MYLVRFWNVSNGPHFIERDGRRYATLLELFWRQLIIVYLDCMDCMVRQRLRRKGLLACLRCATKPRGKRPIHGGTDMLTCFKRFFVSDDTGKYLYDIDISKRLKERSEEEEEGSSL